MYIQLFNIVGEFKITVRLSNLICYVLIVCFYLYFKYLTYLCWTEFPLLDDCAPLLMSVKSERL